MLPSYRHRYRDQQQNVPVFPKEHHTSIFNPILCPASMEPCLLTFFSFDFYFLIFGSALQDTDPIEEVVRTDL